MLAGKAYLKVLLGKLLMLFEYPLGLFVVEVRRDGPEVGV